MTLNWHYGPTATDPNPGSMWHTGCGGEVWYIEDGYICTRCHAQGVDDEPGHAEGAVYLAAWGLHDLVVMEDGFTVETKIGSRSDVSVSEPPKDLDLSGPSEEAS